MHFRGNAGWWFLKFKRTFAVISSEARSAVAELRVVSGRRDATSSVLALSGGTNTNVARFRLTSLCVVLRRARADVVR